MKHPPANPPVAAVQSSGLVLAKRSPGDPAASIGLSARHPGVRVVDLTEAVEGITGMTEICWELGILGIMKDGKTREEAERELGEVWHRCSMAWERRWTPRPLPDQDPC